MVTSGIISDANSHLWKIDLAKISKNLTFLNCRKKKKKKKKERKRKGKGKKHTHTYLCMRKLVRRMTEIYRGTFLRSSFPGLFKLSLKSLLSVQNYVFMFFSDYKQTKCILKKSIGAFHCSKCIELTYYTLNTFNSSAIFTQ